MNPSRLWPLVLLLSSNSIGAAQSPVVAAGAPNYVDVYVAGENAYHTYRIPSVIATLNGTLLAFAEARRSGAADAGDIDLVYERITFARFTLDWLTDGNDRIGLAR